MPHSPARPGRTHGAVGLQDLGAGRLGQRLRLAQLLQEQVLDAQEGSVGPQRPGRPGGLLELQGDQGLGEAALLGLQLLHPLPQQLGADLGGQSQKPEGSAAGGAARATASEQQALDFHL